MERKQNGKSPEISGLRTWIEIDRKAVAHDFRTLKGFLRAGVKFMAVVKSNAYGHGLIDFSKEMQRLGADWLGVDSIVEAVALRREGISLPILVLGYTLPERIEEAVEQDIIIAASGMDQLRSIAATKTVKKPRLHIKVDTGMHRQGFLLSEIPEVVSFLKKNKERLSIEGLFTHFASAKNPAFPEYTNRQLAEFKEWQDAFKSAGFSVLSHAAATGGAMLFPQSQFDLVRFGIGLYGLWPSKETRAHLSDRIRLKPALTWKTIISEIKKLPKGEKIGYDSTEMLLQDSTVAVCPVGYWHGYARPLSGISHVIVRGKRVKVLGRISMDMIMIDITSVPKIKPGDEVILIGHEGNAEVSLYELGDLTDTSWYEVVTRINPLIKRIYR